MTKLCVCVKGGVVKDGCVCDKVVREGWSGEDGWCETKWCANEGSVTVCERWCERCCVKDGVSKLVCERWCVKDCVVKDGV